MTHAYGCNQCCRSFLSGTSLQSHMEEVHSGDGDTSGGQILCLMCGSEFPDISELREHEQDEDHAYECDGCDRAFPLAPQLFNHRQQCSGDQQTVHSHCYLCGMDFTYRSEGRMKQHLHTQHEHKCNKCVMGFNSSTELERHMEEAHTPEDGSEEEEEDDDDDYDLKSPDFRERIARDLARPSTLFKTLSPQLSNGMKTCILWKWTPLTH